MLSVTGDHEAAITVLENFAQSLEQENDFYNLARCRLLLAEEHLWLKNPMQAERIAKITVDDLEPRGFDNFRASANRIMAHSQVKLIMINTIYHCFLYCSQ